MASIVSLDYIEQTISKLKYRSEKSLKWRLIHAIRQCYTDETSVGTLEAIPPEHLIESLWDTNGDTHLANKKRKNLNSVRSSVNKDLQKLFEAGNNPEGITISPENIFVMSDEAKDKALKSFLEKMPGDAPANLDEISTILNVVNDLLSNPEAVQANDPSDRLQKWSEMKNLIQSLSKKIGLQETDSDDIGNGIGTKKSGNDGPENTAGDGAKPHKMEHPPGTDATEDGGKSEQLLKDGDPTSTDAEGEGSAAAGHTSEGQTSGHGQEYGISGMGDGGEDANGSPLPVDEVDDPENIEIEDELEELEFLDTLEPEDASGKNELGESDTGADDRSGDASGVKTGLNGSAGAGQTPEGEAIGHGQEDGMSGMGDSGEDANGSPLTVDEVDDTETIEIEDDIEEVDLLEEIETEETPGGGEVDAPGTGLQTDEDTNGNTDDPDKLSNAQLPMAADNNLDVFEMADDSEWCDNPEKARYLAETFNRSLAAMDKFYNQYIKIPEGKYIIGATQPKKNENPKHTVTLASFYIGKFPVTNVLFEVFVEKTGYKTTAEKLGYGTVYEGRCQKIIDQHAGREKHIWHADIVSKTVEGAFWYQPTGPGSSIHKKRNHPVVQVSIQDALAFAAWTGKRLPSEEEWEAASRTANGFRFPWGNDWQSGACNIEESYKSDTVPVDSYLDFENDFGLVDTLGNVHEWTFCPAPPQSEPNQPASYVAKGGSWISGNDLRLYSHLQLNHESSSNLLGFRSVAY